MADSPPPKMLSLNLISFGYQYDKPKEADLVLSARHFPTPSKEVRQKHDGTHTRLQNDLYHHKDFNGLYDKLLEEILNFISQHQTNIEPAELTLTIAVGCEEGKHRSVAIIERLAMDLEEIHEAQITITHRDLDRRQKQITKQKAYDQRRSEKHGSLEWDS